MLEQIKTDGTENGLSSAEKINASFAQVDINTLQIPINTTNITTNTSNISTLTTTVNELDGKVNINTTNIAQNVSNIASNTSRIQTLESTAAKTYIYDSTTNITTVGDVFVPLVSIVEPNAIAGKIYEMKWAINYSITTANDVVHLRYRQNGGAWTELNKTAKSVNDTLIDSYFYPTVPTTTTLQLELEVRKDTAATGDFTVNYAEAIIEQKT